MIPGEYVACRLERVELPGRVDIMVTLTVTHVSCEAQQMLSGGSEHYVNRRVHTSEGDGFGLDQLDLRLLVSSRWLALLAQNIR